MKHLFLIKKVNPSDKPTFSPTPPPSSLLWTCRGSISRRGVVSSPAVSPGILKIKIEEQSKEKHVSPTSYHMKPYSPNEKHVSTTTYHIMQHSSNKKLKILWMEI